MINKIGWKEHKNRLRKKRIKLLLFKILFLFCCFLFLFGVYNVFKIF